MATSLSPNTQAILLLTAPLIVGRAPRSADLLKPGEYSRLALRLRELNRQPKDLLGPDAVELHLACAALVAADRMQRLLGRGMLLTQAVEQWQKRAIWVISRADAEYPHRLKTRLQEKAPAVLYGCGSKKGLASGGLAVVGSRHVDAELVDYTLAVGELAARAGAAIVSGGAKGIDQAAMRGALENGGRAIGVLADNLERAAMNRDHRELLLDERLVLVSPFDPRAGFNAGNAMQRNKYIYALADAALVVNSDMGKGGTWAGAIEQLDKLHLVPVYFRATGIQPPAFAALQSKGALPWPTPADAEAFSQVFVRPQPASVTPSVAQNSLFAGNGTKDGSHASKNVGAEPNDAIARGVAEPIGMGRVVEGPSTSSGQVKAAIDGTDATTTAPPAEVVFNGVHAAVLGLLREPMRGADIAKALDVSPGQMNIWLKRLVDEGSVEKLRNPMRYCVRQPGLLG